MLFFSPLRRQCLRLELRTVHLCFRHVSSHPSPRTKAYTREHCYEAFRECTARMDFQSQHQHQHEVLTTQVHQDAAERAEPWVSKEPGNLNFRFLLLSFGDRVLPYSPEWLLACLPGATGTGMCYHHAMPDCLFKFYDFFKVITFMNVYMYVYS